MRRIASTPHVQARLLEMKQLCPFAFARGVAAWEAGSDFPPRPADDDCSSEVAYVWLGFMLARSIDATARMQIAEQAGADKNMVEPDPVWNVG
jgi:hypothetical protein